MDKKGMLVWVENASPYRIDALRGHTRRNKNGEFKHDALVPKEVFESYEIGEPMHTIFFTSQQLKKMGLKGVYRKVGFHTNNTKKVKDEEFIEWTE